jgi:hypothetical protein
MNEEALAHWGLSRQKQKQILTDTLASCCHHVVPFVNYSQLWMLHDDITTAVYIAPNGRSMFHGKNIQYITTCGPGNSVGIAINYGLDGPGIESRWRRYFPPVQPSPGAHPASCTMGTGFFPGVKCDRGVTLTTQPLLVPRSWKSRAILLPPSGPQPGL